jgi:hypothetical protein
MMAEDSRDIKADTVDAALGEMKLEESGDYDSANEAAAPNGKYEDAATPGDTKRSRSGTPAHKSASGSPMKDSRGSQTPRSDSDEEEKAIDGEITLTVEPGKAPKLSRKSAQKVAARPPPLYNDLPDSTEEALSVFQRIPECLYGSKSMGKSKMSDDDDSPIDCDCSEHRSECTRFLFPLRVTSLMIISKWQESRMRRRLGLYQSCHQTRMHRWGLSMW